MRWLAAETVVVVLGILIAFQIEEYRDWLDLREQERKAIAGLIVDLQADVAELDAGITARTQQPEAISAFIDLLNDEERSPGAFATAFGGVVRNRSCYPFSDTFDALRENGRVFVLADPRLRIRMSTYQGRPREIVMFIQSTVSDHWSRAKRLARPDIMFALDVLDPSMYRVVAGASERSELAVRLPVSDAPRDPLLVPELANMHAALSNLVGALSGRKREAEALLAAMMAASPTQTDR